jgi:hypothetical protein
MDTVHSEKAASFWWFKDVVLVVVVSGLWTWTVFDLCTGRRKLNFLDGLWLFAGPILVWRTLPRVFGSWNSRRNEA